MGLSDSFAFLSPSSISRGGKNAVRQMWDRVHGWPGGKALFSRLIGTMAPYTGTIGAEVLELRHGHAEVLMRDRRAVRNHLDSVHAVALVNLAELAGNIALAYSLPDDARFIVAGLSIEYLKKARGPIRGICDCPTPETSAKQEYPVLVRLVNEAGEDVAKATLRSLVGPKRE